MSEAIVVGAGPNGLACAAELARAGVTVTVIEAAPEIGGGTRTSELTLPGLRHDHCSATHPMGPSSPALRDLEQFGLRWRRPEIDLAHPLDAGAPGVMVRSIEQTAEGLAEDGRRWGALFGAPARAYPSLSEDLYRPLVHLPRHPVALARFGLAAALPAVALARAFRTPRARALFAGVAAHLYAPLDRPLSASVGAALIVAGHADGWPVAEGGSSAITDALADAIAHGGGRIETGRRVRSLSELAPADAVVLDLDPGQAAEVCGDRLPVRVARAYRRWRHGPAAFKVDLAVHEGVPWRDEACRRAGTVHVGGSFEEIAAAGRAVDRGAMPERPFVLVGQQYLADPSRSAADVHPVWAYAHVPAGYDGDATEAVIAQVERFAPGVRERILATVTRSPAQFQDYNSNFVGGDIVGGANSPRQLVARPRATLHPYATGISGVYICSAATPPGAGAHGINGYNAARAVLARM